MKNGLKDIGSVCRNQFVINDYLECRRYTKLTDKTRKNTYVTKSKKCDNHLGPGWFRFQGDAGTKMPTTCQPMLRCDAFKTGWLRGIHPSVAEGAVNRTVCFGYHNCCTYSVIIRVRNCGSYYVYHLINTPSCTLRYCGTGWKRSELRYDYHISFKIWFPLTSQAFGSSREHFQKSQKNGGGGGGKTSLTSLFPNLCREMRKLHSLSASDFDVFIRFLYWYFISFLLSEVLLDLYLVFNRYLTDITEWSLATIDCSLPYLLAFF